MLFDFGKTTLAQYAYTNSDGVLFCSFTTILNSFVSEDRKSLQVSRIGGLKEKKKVNQKR